ncbi:conserved hypothetical protein [Burkholderia pseudomallei 406e]|nr:conserved hypothetical protein [Burkholderia pseudomallei 406e]
MRRESGATSPARGRACRVARRAARGARAGTASETHERCAPSAPRPAILRRASRHAAAHGRRAKRAGRLATQA